MSIELKDRIAFYISLAALVASICTPIATYYWLDPKIKEVRDQNLIYDFRDLSDHWKMKKNKTDLTFSDFYHIEYIVRLKNTGALPVKDILLSARPRLDSKTTVRFATPVPFDRRDDNETTYMALKRAIGPA